MTPERAREIVRTIDERDGVDIVGVDYTKAEFEEILRKWNQYERETGIHGLSLYEVLTLIAWPDREGA